jgi:hypothetical protein
VSQRISQKVAKKVIQHSERGQSVVSALPPTPSIQPELRPYRVIDVPNQVLLPAGPPPFNQMAPLPPHKTTVGKKVIQKIRQSKPYEIGTHSKESAEHNGHVAPSGTVENTEIFTHPSITIPQEDRGTSLTESKTIGQLVWGAVFSPSPNPKPEAAIPASKHTKTKTAKKRIPAKPKKRVYIPKDLRDPKKKGSVAEQIADKVLDKRLEDILEELDNFEFGFDGKFMGFRKWHAYFSGNEYYKRVYNPLYTLCSNLVKALKYGSEFAATVFSDFFTIFEAVGISMKTDAKVGTIQLWPIYRLVGGIGCIILLLNFLLFLPITIVLRFWGHGMQFVLDLYDYEPDNPNKPRRIFWDVLYNTFISTIRFIPVPFICLYNWIADTVMQPNGFSFEMGEHEEWGVNYNTILFGDGEEIPRGKSAAANDTTEYGLDSDFMMKCLVIPFAEMSGKTWYMIREFNSSNIFIVPDELWNNEISHRHVLPEIDNLLATRNGKYTLTHSVYGKKLLKKQAAKDSSRRSRAQKSNEYGLDVALIADIAGAISSATSDAVGDKWIERKMSEYGSPTSEELANDIWDSSVYYLKKWFTIGVGRGSSRSSKPVDKMKSALVSMSKEGCQSKHVPKYVDAVCHTLGDYMGGGGSIAAGGAAARKVQPMFNETMHKAMESLTQKDDWVYLDPNQYCYSPSYEEYVSIDWVFKSNSNTRTRSHKLKLRPNPRLRTQRGVEEKVQRQIASSIPILASAAQIDPKLYTRKARLEDFLGKNTKTRRSWK